MFSMFSWCSGGFTRGCSSSLDLFTDALSDSLCIHLHKGTRNRQGKDSDEYGSRFETDESGRVIGAAEGRPGARDSATDFLTGSRSVTRESVA